MTITLTINNQYYLNGITELARLAKMGPEDLCRELLCHDIDSFYRDRRKWEVDYVYAQMPERVRKNVEDPYSAVEMEVAP